jgi:hypothetical protein
MVIISVTVLETPVREAAGRFDVTDPVLVKVT